MSQLAPIETIHLAAAACQLRAAQASAAALPASATNPCRRQRASGREQRLRLRVCAWLALLLSVSGAKAQVDADAEGLLVRSAGGDWRQSVALETSVDFRIRGLLAEVSVRQRYVNDSGEWLEGRYLLPLPGQAAVGRLRLHIGERIIEGEIQEKQAAQAAYQAAAKAGQVASLVEQQRPNLFNTAVANIGPGEDVEIEIGYWQPVSFQDGSFSIALPLTLTQPYQPGQDCELATATLDTPVLMPVAAPTAIDLGDAFEPTVSLSVDLDAGIPLASVTSVTHAIDVQPLGEGYSVRLGDLAVASDRDFELRWTPQASALPQQALFAETIGDEHYALLMLLPPTTPVPTVPRELILVIDNSGSMQGESMLQAIAALDRALSRLRPDDRFNVIRFDDTTEQVFPQSVAADAAQVAHARRFVQNLSADGGTELKPALELAFASAPTPGFLRQVVLITDAAIGNEEQLYRLIETGRGQSRLFAVGIGSAPNEHFLRRAVELGRGSQVLVRNTSEVTTRTDALLAKLDAPALRDLELRWPVAAEVYPEQLPDLYVGEPLQVLARLPRLDGELIARGQGGKAAWQHGVALLAAQRDDSRGVARLWARARITALEDQLRAGASEDAIRPQMLQVALQHGIVSRYTSLVTVDKTPARPAGSDLASAGFANAIPDGSLAYAQGATSARAQAALAIALLLLAMLLRGRRRTARVAREG